MEKTREIVVRPAADPAEIAHVRLLMREYGEYLADRPGGTASICLSNYDIELEGLPDPYVLPGALLLAWVDGNPAGCIALKNLRPMDAERTDGLALEFKRLWVGPEFRKLGLGRRLMASAIDHARAAGAGAVYLDTVPAAMPEANRLYEAFGFQRVERYNDNPVGDVVFFKLAFNTSSSYKSS